MAKSVIRNTLAAVLITGGVALCWTGVAFGVPPTPPQSGDSRAVAVAGNAVTCAQAGLAGGIISVTAIITGNTYITITGVPTNTTVTGVVVKGSPAYNLYLPVSLGMLPWVGLHPPLAGKSGQPATISHWFVCGTKTTTTPPTTTTTTTTKSTTTTTTTKSTTTTTAPPTTTTTKTTVPTTTTTTTTHPSRTTTTTTAPTTTTTTTRATTTTNATSTTVPPTTVPPTTTTAATITSTTRAATTAAAVTTSSAGTGGQPLAFTGFSGGQLIVIALVLMLAGLSLLTVPNLLARRR
jgi:hypothetical protein